MKWKDSGGMAEKEEKPQKDYFDEEQYSPWADRKESKRGLNLSRTPALLVLLTLALVAMLAVLMMLLIGDNDSVTARKVAALEDRLLSLEERLDKYTAIDEKVTRIWEQAKSFEKFKDRFDRSEASMSLRMDHLTMSLEALQKQLNESPPVQTATAAEPTAPQPGPAKLQYHEVSTGDTLYSISKKYNLSVAELRKLNRMAPDAIIVPGQKLIVQGAN